MQKRKSYKLTSIPNKDKKHFPRSTQKKRKFLPTKYRGHEKNQHSSTIRLSKRFSFLLEQKIKRKNHPRKTRESNNYPFTPSPPFLSFLPSKKKNKIKWKKKEERISAPISSSSSRRHGMSRPREEEDQDPPLPVQCLCKERGDRAYRLPVCSRRVPAL